MSQQQNEKNVAQATLAVRLAQARSAAKLSMRELSRDSGVDVGYISKIEKGVNENLGLLKAAKLADSLRISADWLLHGEGDMKQQSTANAAAPPSTPREPPVPCILCAAKDSEIAYLRQALTQSQENLAFALGRQK